MSARGLALLLLPLAACAPKAPVAAPAEAPQDVVEFLVVDVDGRPLPGIALTAVMGTSGDRRALRTDDDGVARLVRDENHAHVLIDEELWIGGGPYHLSRPVERLQMLAVPRCTVDVQLTDGDAPARGEVWNRRSAFTPLDDQGRASLDTPCGDMRLVWGPGVGEQRYFDLSPGLGGTFQIDLAAMTPFEQGDGHLTYRERMDWMASGPKGTITGVWDGPKPCSMELRGKNDWLLPDYHGCLGDGTLREYPLPPGEWTITVRWLAGVEGARPERAEAVVRTTLPPGGAIDLGILRPGMGTREEPLDLRPPAPSP